MPIPWPGDPTPIPPPRDQGPKDKGPKGTKGTKGTQGGQRDPRAPSAPFGVWAHGALWGYSEAIPSAKSFRVEGYYERKAVKNIENDNVFNKCSTERPWQKRLVLKFIAKILKLEYLIIMWTVAISLQTYWKLYSDIERSLQNDRTSHEQIKQPRHKHTNKLKIVAKCWEISQKVWTSYKMFKYLGKPFENHENIHETHAKCLKITPTCLKIMLTCVKITLKCV